MRCWDRCDLDDGNSGRSSRAQFDRSLLLVISHFEILLLVSLLQSRVSSQCCIKPPEVCGLLTFVVLLCQAGSGVRCVLALVGRDAERLTAVEAELTRYGAMRYTTIVSAPAGAVTLAKP